MLRGSRAPPLRRSTSSPTSSASCSLLLLAAPSYCLLTSFSPCSLYCLKHDVKLNPHGRRTGAPVNTFVEAAVESLALRAHGGVRAHETLCVLVLPLSLSLGTSSRPLAETLMLEEGGSSLTRHTFPHSLAKRAASTAKAAATRLANKTKTSGSSTGKGKGKLGAQPQQAEQKHAGLSELDMIMLVAAQERALEALRRGEGGASGSGAQIPLVDEDGWEVWTSGL